MDALKNGLLKTDPKAPDPAPWEGPSDHWEGSSAGRLYPDGSSDGGDSSSPWDLPGGPGGPGEGGGGWSLPGWMKGLAGALGQAAGLISPLVLDLDGDGVELTSLSTSKAAFDLDADGFAEHTGWVKADDGLLVWDRDGNGRIDDITELFGSDTAADGFVKLASLDQNGDRSIDANDAHFSDLRVWIDRDQDGFSDAAELKSLQELGVAAVSLDAQAVHQTIEGNAVSAVASYTRSDGTAGTVADVWFANDQTLTLYNDPSVHIPDTALLLPYLRGYGQVADLYIAVAKNADLMRTAGEIVCSQWASLDALKAEVEDFVYRWAGTQDVVTNSRGGEVDARKLATLEKFTGMPFEHVGGGTYMGPNTSAAIDRAFDQLVDAYAARFLVTGLYSNLSSFAYDPRLDVITGDPFKLAEELRDTAPADPAAAIRFWTQTVAVVDLLATQLDQPVAGFDAAINQALRPSLGISAADLRSATPCIGTAGAEALTGSQQNDLVLGLAGNDTLKGGYGSDTYLFNRGDGQGPLQKTW